MKRVLVFFFLACGLLFASVVTVHSQVQQVWIFTTLAGSAGNAGGADGTNSYAQFDWPRGVAVDGAGNVYVADSYNSTIRKVTPVGTNWVVSTLAGLAGSYGTNDGTGSDAQFYYPAGVAVDSAGRAGGISETLPRQTPDRWIWGIRIFGQISW